VPEYGAGLLVTHVQASPPVLLPYAPAGSASSTQATSVAGGGDGGEGGGGGTMLVTVTVTLGAVAVFPAASRATAVRVCAPSAAVVESHETV
jgi:hypothetical protein